MGHEVVIFSKKVQSKIYGAQFLHQAIPGLTSREPDGEVHIFKLGEEANYARRVYGDSRTPTSWRKLDQSPYPAWELRYAYDRAWDKFEPLIVDQKLDASEVRDLTAFFPVVISTVPLWALCLGGHTFSSVDILVTKRTFGNDVNATINRGRKMPENYVIYNGDLAYQGWYRTSSIFGYESTEVVAQTDPKHEIFNGEREAGYKIEGTDCDCHPNLIKTGRMGTWKRGVLTHHAYLDTITACQENALIV
jgi:hypothetical protein